MYWRMQGHRGDQLVEVTWTDGTLSGDTSTVQLIEQIATASEGQVISSVTDDSVYDHLSNPRTAATLFDMICTDHAVTLETDVPLLPPLPEGAIE